MGITAQGGSGGTGLLASFAEMLIDFVKTSAEFLSLNPPAFSRLLKAPQLTLPSPLPSSAAAPPSSARTPLAHTNACLDKGDDSQVTESNGQIRSNSHGQVVDANPVHEWLRSLGLSKYEETFSSEEIDWDTLHWLTKEGLLSIGISALGPTKKIAHGLKELRNKNTICVTSLLSGSYKEFLPWESLLLLYHCTYGKR